MTPVPLYISDGQGRPIGPDWAFGPLCGLGGAYNRAFPNALYLVQSISSTSLLRIRSTETTRYPFLSPNLIHPAQPLVGQIRSGESPQFRTGQLLVRLGQVAGGVVHDQVQPLLPGDVSQT